MITRLKTSELDLTVGQHCERIVKVDRGLFYIYGWRGQHAVEFDCGAEWHIIEHGEEE